MQYRIVDWPGNTEGPIVPAEPACCRGFVELRHLVPHLAVVFEGNETVCESLGDIQSAPRRSIELDAEMAHVGGRRRAQINDDIPDSSPAGANQFGFGVGFGLPMHAPQRPAVAIVGNVALRKLGVESHPSKLASTPCAREEAALDLALLDVYDESSGERGRLEDHG